MLWGRLSFQRACGPPERRSDQSEEGKLPLRIRPQALRVPAVATRQLGEGLDFVLSGTFGVNGFAMPEGEAPAGHRDHLVNRALKMHFHRGLRLVPARDVTKLRSGELSVQLPVDAHQDVAIEL